MTDDVKKFKYKNDSINALLQAGNCFSHVAYRITVLGFYSAFLFNGGSIYFIVIKIISLKLQCLHLFTI